MKFYKFSKGEYVSLNRDYPFLYSEKYEYNRKFKVIYRKKDNKENLYELQEVISHKANWKTKLFWKLWEVYKNIVYFVIPSKYSKIINKTTFWDKIEYFQTPILSEETFKVGFRNIPRMDNFIQEERLIKYKPINNSMNEVKPCIQNSCEMVNRFLEEPLPQEVDTLGIIE